MEGYGHAVLPSHPGHHTLTLDTWRPVGSSPAAEMKRWVDVELWIVAHLMAME